MSTEKKKEKGEWSGKRDDEKARFLWAGGKSCTSWLRGVCVRRSSPGTVVLTTYQGCYGIELTPTQSAKGGVLPPVIHGIAAQGQIFPRDHSSLLRESGPGKRDD